MEEESGRGIRVQTEGKYTAEDGREERGRKGRKEEPRKWRRETIGKQMKGTEKEGEGEREKARGSNLPFSSLKRRVYQDEESQEGIKGV